ncbi:MAG: PorP/SprF family type IX secretion system membrane protein [Bacteroidia bacterium]|nr:PorP/SprF family type IX secretion system membrane protein [Bacteroidia bacterium]
MKTKPIHILNKFVLFIVFLVLSSMSVNAQDVHFSQYNGSVLNLNPAFTGLFDGDYRVNGIFRSQWSSVPVPYQSFSIAGDGRFKTKKMKSDCFGVGIMFNNDKSGDTHYGTNQLYLSASYIHKLNTDSTLLLSLGLNGGVSNVGFNYSLMTFDNQYQGNTYNAANNTGEHFTKTASTFGDFSFGTALQYALKQRAYIQYGISFHHFTSPKLTFQNNNSIKIDPKLNNSLCFAYPVGANTDVLAEVLVSNQGKYNEIVPGAQIKLRLDETRNQVISAGIYYRLKDAAIARVGYQVKTLTAGISYDVNMSKFLAATNRRGGFEIYVTYIFKKLVPFVPKTRVCPIYM